MTENNQKCLEILNKLNLSSRIVTHEPILNYETANKVDKEEMQELTGMLPGCMTPFGLKENLIKKVVVDKKVYDEQKLILAFGSETMSVEMTSKDLKIILENTYKKIIYIEN